MTRPRFLSTRYLMCTRSRSLWMTCPSQLSTVLTACSNPLALIPGIAVATATDTQNPRSGWSSISGLVQSTISQSSRYRPVTCIRPFSLGTSGSSTLHPVKNPVAQVISRSPVLIFSPIVIKLKLHCKDTKKNNTHQMFWQVLLEYKKIQIITKGLQR